MCAAAENDMAGRSCSSDVRDRRLAAKMTRRVQTSDRSDTAAGVPGSHKVADPRPEFLAVDCPKQNIKFTRD
jgi:hypothetical protein